MSQTSGSCPGCRSGLGGFLPKGGSKNSRQSERPTESPLHKRIRLVRGITRSRWGYFLRAETMQGLLTYLEENPSLHQPEIQYHERSHGQAISELMATKLGHMAGRGGFLVLHAPEAGLSLMSQISLATQLGQLRGDGIQVVMATHSPLLAATPGARIIELDETGFEPRDWDELKTVPL